MDRCRDCTRPIRWERTWPGAKQLMLDREPSSQGTVRVIGLDDADELQDHLGGAAGIVGRVLDAPIGTAVTLNWLQCKAARELAWQLHTVHAATCPARTPEP